MLANSRFHYRHNQTREISFPLGGLGTGSIGLAGNGRLIDWEIFNRPNKGSFNGFSHFSVKAERGGEIVDARILQGDLHPPYSGIINGPAFNSFGFGPSREFLTGLPHFQAVDFTGEFPIARLDFVDDKFPGQVRLTAFNPFIPLNDFDSGLPAAFFEFEIENTTSESLVYTLLGTLSNPLPANNLHTIKREPNRAYLHLGTDRLEASEVGETPKNGLGDLTLAVESEEISAQAYWYRGGWFDNLEIYWQDFKRPGELNPRSYPPEKAGANNSGSLAARFTLPPKSSRRVRFVITWNFPYYENYWNNDSNKVAQEKGLPTRWVNYYATQFIDSLVSAHYAMENWDRLFGETLSFKEALYCSDLDPVVIDAVAANLAVIKSPTVARLENGTFYGFEGCHANAGCCEGSCTHVWNYAQAVPFLFPALERSMREADYSFNQRGDGGMRFRLPLPEGLTAEDYWVFHPCADGQFGDVLKTYADWKICGDTKWLRKFWPAIKKSIEFAWSPSNEYRWDPKKTGVLSGRMHHTLDMELYSPDAWLTGFYLAALKAGAEIAEVMGEPETATEYRRIFEKGKAWVDTHLFNGEYYHQLIDLKDRSILEKFESGSASLSGKVMDAYWDAEHQEIKYQIGEGCEIDQLLAQFHANIYGLGDIFDPAQARTALGALYKYNFKKPMREAYNPCRVFALNDEAGLVMCAWPEGAQKPVIPIPYSQEVMTGFEYAAAVLMIQSGLVEEGLQVVAAVRDRYDGEKRNPWNEIECGSNYARSMASYGLLTAFSGFEFDLSKKMIGFNPIRLQNNGSYKVFWSLASGWGMYRQAPEKVMLEIINGGIELHRLRLPFLKENAITSIYLGNKVVEFTQNDGEIRFNRPVKIWKDSSLVINLA
jgi:non-lysosomal glucosylceramidase